MGGTLIRKVLALFKEQGFPLPIAGRVYLAVSGGVDSMVLAHLIIRYGRKVIAPEQVTLLHFDHGWRPESATLEKEGVRKLAAELGVAFLSRQLPMTISSSQSTNAEEDARLKRTEVYESIAGPSHSHAYVFTGHHQDDLAETLIFRFLRGEFFERHHGILFKDHCVLRPLLKVSKEELREYSKQESVPFFEDPTTANQGSFRSWYRTRIRGHLEEHFPKFHLTLARYAERKHVLISTPLLDAVELLSAQKLNRTQRKAVSEMVRSDSTGKSFALSGGIQVRRVKEGLLIENLDALDSL